MRIRTCSGAAEPATAAPERLPVVIDTDIGGDIDDAFALALAVASPELEVVGVTTVGRGTDRDPFVRHISADRDEDMKLHTRIDPHLALAIDVEGKSAWVATRDGTLRKYSYPEFRLQGRWRPALTAYQLAVDGKSGRLYVAGFDPRSVAERPRAKGHGDIHVYAIEGLK